MGIRKRKKEKRWHNIWIGIAGIALIFAGLFLLVFNHIHEYRLHINEYIPTSVSISTTSDNNEPIDTEFLNTYDAFWKPIVNNAGITLLVLGIGSLFLELYGYASYFKKRVAEVFTEKEMLDVLNKEYKSELKSNVIESIYSPNTKDSREILSLFDKSLGDLLESKYYNRYDSTTKISLYNDRYMKKTYVRIMEVTEINTEKKNTYENVIDVYCQDLSEIGIESFVLDSLEVGGVVLVEDEDYEVKHDPIKRHDDGDRYTIHHYCKLKSPHEIVNSLKVMVEYTTIVPIEDTTVSFKTDFLCKEFYSKFVFDQSLFDVDVVGFNFCTDEKPRPFEKLKGDGWKSIRSQGWLLPGEGVLGTILRRSS